MTDRPYPYGLAWDEALRQRTRAEQLEKKLEKLSIIVNMQIARFSDLDSQHHYDCGSLDAYKYIRRRMDDL